MPSNLLNEGVDALYAIKNDLAELEDCRRKYMEAEDEENRLEKAAEEKERQQNEEIRQTTAARKNEISASYDEQIDNLKAQRKKINGKKEKQKNKKMSRRIEQETADLAAENRQLMAEAKTLFKKGRIPRLFQTRYYFSLFAPKGAGDLGLILLTLLAALLLIPCGIYFLLLPEPKAWMLVLIYCMDILLFGGIYLLIYHNTKGKHLQEIRAVRDLRNKVRMNKKKIQAIKNSIVKDSDESPYGLEDFDRELAELDGKLAGITEQKRDTLKIFESETKDTIAEEISFRYRGELDGLHQDYSRAHQECLRLADEIKDISLTITKEYGGYLGKEFLTAAQIDALIEKLESGQAQTVSEAVSLLKKPQ